MAVANFDWGECVGLDLVVEGCAKPGYEREWRRLVERAFSDRGLPDQEVVRFNEISIPAYERIGAPRVGTDPAANAWIIEARQAVTPDDIRQALEEFDGYYVIRLVSCDGVPTYSNGGLYDGVDETSFRGAFLKDCGGVIDNRLQSRAWEHKLPEAAVDYGRALLDAAQTAETAPLVERKGLLSRLGLTKPSESIPLSEQLDIVRSAGRWYVFWGELGHPIRAYF